MAAAFVSDGSPRLGKKTSQGFKILDQNPGSGQSAAEELSAPTIGQASSKISLSPLKTTMLANRQAKMDDKMSKYESLEHSTNDDAARMDDILARLRLNDSKQPSAVLAAPQDEVKNGQKSLNKLLTNLNGHNTVLKKQGLDLKDESDSDGPKDGDRSSGSELFTPATESFDVISAGDQGEAAEILRVKQELAAAKSMISRQEQELAETRKLKHTMDQAMGPPSEADFSHHDDLTDRTINHLHSAFNAAARPFTSQSDPWNPQEDTRSDNSDPMSAGGYNRGRGFWNNPTQPSFPSALNVTAQPTRQSYMDPIAGAGPDWHTGFGTTGFPNQGPQPTNQRIMPGTAAPTYGFDGRYGNDAAQYAQTNGLRRTMSQFNRPGPGFANRATPFGSIPSALTGLGPASIAPLNIPGQYGGYQPRPIGSPLSPSTSDFTTGSLPTLGSPWSSMGLNNSQTYVASMEPLNYRRLLDKSVSCDWKYIVDKIVCSNDQQASIFLQQKLKVGTAEQKFEIVEAIVNQAYPLMINRFGNFLVQRCFEHGTPDQVVAIANAIHGNVLSLSMDAFGCHVIQKAFDSVPESHKADMVRELLRRIPDTVIHRYACHVWQKLFELRWSGEPPQIMLKVNEALRDMWHEVALGETGSLVVQNIFENCVEEEKRPAIEEVIASIDLVAHGQFGNWCIQHLCEHGSPPDKRRVIDHILTNAYSYSIDQFASKVVEKCLKIGGVEFLERYLGVITTAHPDRPRIPLIDISGDQYGNYLIQWILMNTHHHQREQVAVHIRKHMVSLRGSKFGSRVAMLCCNPASITRPGPGVIVNPFGAPGQPRGWGRFR